MKLAQLIEGLPIRVTRGDADGVRICDLTEDSRSAMPGSLFVARTGQRADGTRFIADADRAGAVAILAEREPAGLLRSVVLLTDAVPLMTAKLAERFYGNPSDRVSVIGVTGTNGKTTVAWLMRSLLQAAGTRCGLMGTIMVDDGRGERPASHTTAPAIELSRSLAVMAEHKLGHAAIEVSSHALDQHRASGVRFAAGVFTNLSGDHLDYHGTMDNYAAAKARLFEMLPAGAVAIVNADDPWHARMVKRTAARVVRCGIGHECLAETVAAAASGTDVVLRGPWGAARGRVALVGGHNVENLLHAVAAGVMTSDLDAPAIEAALASVGAPPGRLEPVGAGQPRVLVDYAHTDDALARVLASVREVMTEGRLWVVFGCGGDRDRTKRPRMGAAAAAGADRVVVTSDNPRTESPSAIIDEVLAGIADRDRVAVHADREAAIRSAICDAGEHDVVLIAGKGHETEQIVPDGSGGTRALAFDDRAVAADALLVRQGGR